MEQYAIKKTLFFKLQIFLKKVLDIIIFSVIITVIKIYDKIVAGYREVKKQEGD